MAVIVIYPLSSRVGRVREIARNLDGKRGDEATAYWRVVVAAQRRAFDRLGVSRDEADGELRSLFEAVQAELVRVHLAERSDGAA